MKLKDARKLHNEDEVTVKRTGEILRIIESRLDQKMVYLLLSDGEWYDHKEIK